ncbi:MAG: hypothetical protein KDD42_06350 [Bdellovibrionales bacterium]|nr:hypothetical protein [Bdellovibrionales bacterium]
MNQPSKENVRQDSLKQLELPAADRAEQPVLHLNGISKIVCAMPGAGKSTFADNAIQAGFKVVDADPQHFKFLSDKLGRYVDRSGEPIGTAQERVANPNFTQEYFAHIVAVAEQADLVLISTDPQIRQALIAEGIEFDLVRFETSMKAEVLSRILNRDTQQPNKIIADVVDGIWDSQVASLDQPGPKKIFVLQPGQFLDDLFHFDADTASLNPDQVILTEAFDRAHRSN